MFPVQLWPRNKAKFIQIWDKLAYIKQGFNQEKFERPYKKPLLYYLIIIMYIYHALINALSAHMICINLNISYTHVEHSPTKTIYIKYYTNKKTKNKNKN